MAWPFVHKYQVTKLRLEGQRKEKSLEPCLLESEVVLVVVVVVVVVVMVLCWWW